MPYPTDKFDESTLPDPELNPLLNPLLAAHMGRWAEVYFTTPPEKRGQAVTELLRRLEADSQAQPAPPAEPAALAIDGENSAKKIQASQAPDPLLNAAEPVLICSACGHNNPAGQRFCGMCGAALQIQPDAIEVSHSDPIAETSWKHPGSALNTNPADFAIEPARRFDATRHFETLEPAWRLPENDVPHFAREPEPVPYRYRLYVGVALAGLLALLIYMAWRGTEVLSGGQQSLPSRTIPAAQPAPAATEQPATKANAAPVVPVEKVEKPVEKKQSPPELPAQNERPESNVQTRQAAVRSAPRIAPVAASSSTFAADQSGNEELAMAERYLNITGRNSGEAAQWLWKAVSKGNPAATIALSDLYLRGDGVPKSCDQARLLLDAAARKGVKGAGDRLRNMPAFGCR